jgi:hypothetical protein
MEATGKVSNRFFLHAWIAGALLLGGCGSSANPDVYHVGTHEWVGDSIYVQVYRTSAPTESASLPGIKLDCRSCNLTNAPLNLDFSDSGVAHIYIPEARQLISARLHLHGHGIDTTFIQKQRPPDEAMKYFHLAIPLVGRVLVDRFALLYLDTTQDSVVSTANVGDELNIYSSTSAFYSVQHPNFAQPLYLLKLDAVRLQ